MFAVGIDPGLSGGICLMSKLDKTIIYAVKMPNIKGKQDNKALVDLIKKLPKNAEAGIEEQFIIKSQGGSSGMTTMESYGIIIGILLANNIPVRKFRSQTWFSYFKSFSSNKYPDIEDLSIKDTKKKSLSLVKTIYPSQSLLPTPRCTKLSDGISDSILIARYICDN
jgi:hypothetical protein